MPKDSNLLVRGASARVLQTLINIGIGFWMLPFLITNLGSADYALWVLVGSVISSYYILDLGLTQAVTRYVAKHIYRKEYDLANNIINTALLIYSLLAVIIFIIIIFAVFYIAPTLVENAKELRTVQVLFIISGLSLGLEFPSKAFPGIINAYMRFDTIAAVRTLGNIFSAIAIYFYISTGYGVVSLAVIVLLTNVCTTGFFIYYSVSLFSHLEISKNHIYKKDIQEIFHFSKWTFIVDLTNILKSKMDIWFIAAYLSTSAVTVYYVAVRLTDYACQIATQALGITGPIFTKYYAQGELKKLNETLIFFFKLYLIVFALIFTGFYTLGESFLIIWVKGTIDHSIAYQSLIILSLGRLAILSCNPFNSYLMTIKKHKYTAYLSILDTTIAIGLAFILIPLYGALGAALAFSASVAVIRLIALPIILHRFIKIILAPTFLRAFIFLLYSAVIIVLLESYKFQITSWSQLIVPSVLIFVLIMLGTFLLFDAYEKRKIYNFIQEKFK
ncbi:oligosaccharide flippase family protein [Colwellia sp. BRX8-4]|uniref:lipopolysaccharide biosynthesis protein n=1 Tax=Colwellia sp. BRX8-4 TaxID=2759836 RepID=UPI0015F4A94A|nr:oligosaccharide flippase family protein [Colwellia sp. BRX8-4]MBA6372138.1 oligosaccharide flippase family protein [Colwellia sp. BRX8-4]